MICKIFLTKFHAEGIMSIIEFHREFQVKNGIKSWRSLLERHGLSPLDFMPCFEKNIIFYVDLMAMPFTSRRRHDIAFIESNH